MKRVTISDVQSLPQWAIDLFAARQLRRVAESYRKAHPRAPMLELFEALAIELESGSANQSTLRTLHSRLEVLLQSLGTPQVRAPVVGAQSLCLAAPSDRPFAASLWIDGPVQAKSQRRSDERRMIRAELHDFRGLKEMESSERPVDAPTRLGELWPCGKPAWLSLKWPTLRDQVRQVRNIWMEDEPRRRVRTAPRRVPSKRLPEYLRERLGQARWNLVCAPELEVLSKGKGRRAVPTFRRGPTAVRRQRIAVAARTGLRRHGDAALLRQWRFRSRDVPSLRPLWAFLREHDGALLFWRDGSPSGDALIELLGVADQRAALRHFKYLVDHAACNDPDRVRRCLKVLGCHVESVFVVAQADGRYFALPTSGPKAGNVFRFMSHSCTLEPFASSFLKAVGRFVENPIPLLRNTHLETEAADSKLTYELRLVRIEAMDLDQ